MHVAEGLVCNAVVKETRVGFEDHGILTALVVLEDALGVQGFGNYAFDWMNGNERCYSTNGSHFLRRVLEVAGRDQWGALPGTVVRVRRAGGGPILAIGHAIKEEWFDPRVEFAQRMERERAREEAARAREEAARAFRAARKQEEEED